MFDQQYPNLAAWILDGDCWVELGTTDYSRSTLRILDIGGMIWESERSYASVAAMLADAEQALTAWPGRMKRGIVPTSKLYKTEQASE